MTDITRTNPFNEAMTLREAMNQLLADSFVSPRQLVRAEHKALDLYETDQEYVARLAVPGLKPDDFEITMQDGVLAIRGQTRAEQQQEGTRYHIREQSYGAFDRRVQFPSTVDADKIEASLADGILTVRVPKAEAARPRRITVQASAS
jgi:HSP20 family protein